MFRLYSRDKTDTRRRRILWIIIASTLFVIVLLTLSLPKPFTNRNLWNQLFSGSNPTSNPLGNPPTHPPAGTLYIHHYPEGGLEWALHLPVHPALEDPVRVNLSGEPDSVDPALTDPFRYIGLAPEGVAVGSPKIRSSNTGNRIVYPLIWNHQPIKGMEITADFNETGQLQILRGPYIKSWPPPPADCAEKLSSEELIAIATRWLLESELPFDAGRGDTLWTGSSGWDITPERWIGVGEVWIQTTDPPADWFLTIDEAEGVVIKAEDRLLFDKSNNHDGAGSVFTPNPVVMSGDYNLRWGDPVEDWVVTRRLTHLDGSGWLRGRYAAISTGLPPRTYRPNLQYIVASYHPGFEEVMAYFHITETADDLRSRGLLPDGDPFSVRVHASNIDNSWYRPSTRMIEYGDGGVPDAQDADIILHEFGHAVHDRLVPGFGEGQTIALSEGFSDYLACSYTGDPCLGEWDATYYSPPCLRSIDELRIYPDDWTDRPHTDGLIWAGALWEIREQLGEGTALDLSLRTMKRTSRWSSFVEAAEILAALAANPTAAAPPATPLIVRGILEKRGLLTRKATVELSDEDRLALPLNFPFPVGDTLSWGLEILGEGKIVLRDHPQSYESSTGDTTLEISPFIIPDKPPQAWVVAYDVTKEFVSIEMTGLYDGVTTQRSRIVLYNTGKIHLSWGGEGQGLGSRGLVQVRSTSAPPDTIDLMTDIPRDVSGIYYQTGDRNTLANGSLVLTPIPTPANPPGSDTGTVSRWTAEWEFYPEQSLPEDREFIFTKTPTHSPLIVHYQLQNVGDFKLEVVDVGGRRVKSLDLGNRSPGSYTWKLSAEDLSSGVYWVRLMNHTSTLASQKVLVLR